MCYNSNVLNYYNRFYTSFVSENFGKNLEHFYCHKNDSMYKGYNYVAFWPIATVNDSVMTSKNGNVIKYSKKEFLWTLEFFKRKQWITYWCTCELIITLVYQDTFFYKSTLYLENSYWLVFTWWIYATFVEQSFTLISKPLSFYL